MMTMTTTTTTRRGRPDMTDEERFELHRKRFEERARMAGYVRWKVSNKRAMDAKDQKVRERQARRRARLRVIRRARRRSLARGKARSQA
jgi:hypothetical protein